jgi:hypothetical protein
MRISLKIAIYSIVYVLCAPNLSLAKTPTDQEIRGLQALEDIQFTITSLAERPKDLNAGTHMLQEVAQGSLFEKMA